MKQEGYIFMGFGEKYIDECVLCAEMIESWDKNRPKAILTSKKDYKYAKSKFIFDDVVVLDYEKEEDLKDEKNSHNLYCVIPRVLMSKYLPYEKTLAIDSDIACISDPEPLWNYINLKNEPFICCGIEWEDIWHWGQVNKIVEKIGFKIPSIHGGVLCFNKSHEKYQKFKEDCFDALHHYTDYGCLNNFRGGMTDEVIFSIAMARNNITPLDYVEFPVVSFNLPISIELPCYFHTRNGIEPGTYKKCDSPIIFNHIFFHEGNNQTLYRWYKDFHKKIINNI